MATLKQGKKLLEIFEDTSTEKMQDILASGLLIDLRDVENIGNVDRNKLQELLGLKTLLLKFITTVAIPATTEKFIAKDKLVVNAGGKAKVKISNFGDLFRKEFLGKVENPIRATIMGCHMLLKPSMSTSIISARGGKRKIETTLTEMYLLMEKQGNGEEGALLTKEWCQNIFYIRNSVGVLRAVFVCWHSDGWSVFAFPIEHTTRWSEGFQVFSRSNSKSKIDN